MTERPATALPRRLGAALAAIPVLAVGLADAVIAARTHDHGTTTAAHATQHRHRPGPSAEQQAAARRTAALRALLDRRAQAVLHHDEAAFLASVDPNQPKFVAAQRQYFTNVEAVPLATWSYDFDSSKTQPSTARASRYDAPTWAPQVFSLHYAIRGFDTTPTTEMQYPTFVHRAQGWVIASFSDFSSLGDDNDTELWDFGRVITARAPHVLVLGHPQSRALMQQLADETSADIPRVTAVWGRNWPRRVVVEVPTTEHELQRVVGDHGNLSQIAAVASAEVQDCPGPPNPVGNRVAINPFNWPKLSPLGKRIVLTHELTHVATRADTGSCTPTWIVEGFADYIGYLGSGISTDVVAQELAADVRAGRVPTHLPRDSDFDGANRRLPQAYEAAWMACRLIVSRWGQSTLVKLYQAIGTSDLSPEDAVDGAMQALLRVSLPRFIAMWRDYLRAQLS